MHPDFVTTARETDEPWALTDVEMDVRVERKAQDAKWGEQNHPDGTAKGWDDYRARTYRDVCQRKAQLGEVTWKDILREEVYEAFAERDPAKLRAELLQVAAVSVAWIEAIDRRIGR